MSGEAFAQVGDLRLCHEAFGRPGDPPVLLVAGVGAQMIAWDDAFCARLADRGLFVVRFDNRDVGRSTHLDGPKADLERAARGDRSGAPYLLEDMADDIAGLAIALDLPAFHVVGVSMGGMIAQSVAARHPDRVRSLTSIMSTTSPDVGRATPEALAVLFGPPPAGREETADRAVANARVIGSPGHPLEEERIRAKALRAYDRGLDPAGVGRQFAAILASGDRSASLTAVRAPTFVLHGADDPLIGVAGGHATAAAIPHARLEVIPGMGHDLPTPLWDLVIDRIATVVAQGEIAQSEAARPR